MRHGKHTLIVVLALTGLAIAIPAAQASGQPQDSRPVYRGMGPAPALSPDDRSFNRAGPVVSTAKISSPDDRSFSRSTPQKPVSNLVSDARTHAASSVPLTDARHSALLMHRAERDQQPAAASVQPRGFAWGDAAIGGTFGLVIALLGAGALAMALHHRRGFPRTA